jgi:hypothetical protein
MSFCVLISCFFDVGEAAYGYSTPPAAVPRFCVECLMLGVGSAVRTASSSLVSIVVSGREASSFQHVLGLHTSGAEPLFFNELHVLHGNAPLVCYSMFRLSGHFAQWLSPCGRWEALDLVHLQSRSSLSSRSLSRIQN